LLGSGLVGLAFIRRKKSDRIGVGPHQPVDYSLLMFQKKVFLGPISPFSGIKRAL